MLVEEAYRRYRIGLGRRKLRERLDAEFGADVMRVICSYLARAEEDVREGF